MGAGTGSGGGEMPSRGGTDSLLKDAWPEGEASSGSWLPLKGDPGKAASFSVHQSSPFKMLMTACTLPKS